MPSVKAAAGILQVARTTEGEFEQRRPPHKPAVSIGLPVEFRVEYAPLDKEDRHQHPAANDRPDTAREFDHRPRRAKETTPDHTSRQAGYPFTGGGLPASDEEPKHHHEFPGFQTGYGTKRLPIAQTCLTET